MADLDLDKLMTDADAVTVANAIGMQVFKKGNHYFSFCPVHEEKTGKRDTHPTNFIIKPKGGFCYSCGEFVSIPKMVTSFLGCKKNEAYDIIADAMGGKDFYQADKSTRREQKQRFNLSAEEAELLGISGPNMTRINEEDPPMYEGFSVLFQENPAKCKQIIRERAEALRNQLLSIIDNYGSQNAPKAHEVYTLMGEEFDQKIYPEITRSAAQKVEALNQVIAKFE